MDQNELDSTCGVSDDELTKRFIEAVRIENEIKKQRALQFPAMIPKRILLTCFMQMEQKNMCEQIRKPEIIEYFYWPNEDWSKEKILQLTWIPL